MEKHTRFRLIALFVAVTTYSTAHAVNPPTLSFQGVLRDAIGKPVTSPAAGTAVTFSLYPSATGGSAVWTEVQSVRATNGVFSVSLGAVSALGIPFDKAYWLGVKIAGEGTEMTPRLALQSAPYALGAWNVGGNAGTAPSAFLGTTDDHPLSLKVNGHRAAQYREATDASGARSVNILAGADNNTIADGVVGSVIAGGGLVKPDLTGAPNDLRGNYSVIAGGSGNFTSAGIAYAVTGGGSGNVIQADFGTIGGGESNNTQGQWSTIGGGAGNFAPGTQSTVAGGSGNQAGGAGSFIGGGTGGNASGDNSVVAGGSANTTSGSQGFVGAGHKNIAGALAAVGAGDTNMANGLRSFIGSGSGNVTGPGYDAFIGGGQNNKATGGDSVVAGGYQNQATGDNSSVAGGNSNVAKARNAAVGGGLLNTSSGENSTVAGGWSNAASGLNGFVGGGTANIAPGEAATIGGGYNNYAPGKYATIPGGASNAAVGAAFAAGYRANAAYTGSFVWSDYSAEQNFSSQADNQFCIRAKGGVVIESFANPAIYTGQSPNELNRYLSLLNSYAKPSASGLKAGGILCADDFAYSNPNKNNLVVKGAAAIGGPSAGSWTLWVNGSAGGSTAWAAVSDGRLKTDVATYPDALDTVSRLRGVSFSWRQGVRPGLQQPSGRQVGFIAQEVESVLPEVVRTDADGYKSVAYAEVVPVLVEAVKTLRQQNADLQARVDGLARAIEEIQQERSRPGQ